MTIKEVEELIRFVAKANVSEVEFETKDVKLVIKTNKAAERTVEVQMQAPAAQPAPVRQAPPPASEAPAPKVQVDADAKYITVKSPMIGRLQSLSHHRAPKSAPAAASHSYPI